MKVAWEKWQPEKKKVLNDGWEDNDLYEEEGYENEASTKHLILTPFEANGQGKPIYSEDDFNLWLGHSDFPLTVDLLFGVSDRPGVETVDGISKYRFRLGIGKLFSASQVMSEVAQYMVEQVNGSGT
jgi:hypothetical protein